MLLKTAAVNRESSKWLTMSTKTGSLTNAQHDAAIVYAGRPYVLAILTQDLEREQALALERDISFAINARAHS